MRRPPTQPSQTSLAARNAALEAENRELQRRLRSLTEEGLRNESLLRKTQQRELDLLRAGSFSQLLDRVIHGLKESYQLATVSLILHDPEHEIRHLIPGDGLLLEDLQDVRFVDALDFLPPQLAQLEQPWLGPCSGVDHGPLLQARALGSLAVIPLRRGAQLDGLLVFGSEDPRRFSPELASDFLAHLGVVVDVCIESAVNRARLLRSGLVDFLTGFHNRRYLHARLREELARAQRARQPVACLMIDIDHFKRINDQHGHLAGDAVLREVALRIDAQLRMSDTGARFGGDEFAIVLPQASADEGEKVALRIVEAVRSGPIVVGSRTIERVTLSIGVAASAAEHAGRDYESFAERLMAEADAALYRAKSHGRDRVAVSPSLVA